MKNHKGQLSKLGVSKGRVYAQPATDLLTLGGQLNDRPPTADDLGSSWINLR